MLSFVQQILCSDLVKGALYLQLLWSSLLLGMSCPDNFFLEYAGELHIIALRRGKRPK